MEINTYLSIITLNVNGLNTVMKRHWQTGLKKKRAYNLRPIRNPP